MNYLAWTISEYIYEESKKPGTYKFILPSYPSALLLDIGSRLEKSFGNVMEGKVKFIYGIAYRLGQRWQSSNDPAEQGYFSAIQQKGWYNQGNNLTFLRNEIKSEEEDTLVTLLAGYDDIDDRGGLGDFFHLDQGSIWNICLKRSFKPWLNQSLKDFINLEDFSSNVDAMDDLFSNMYKSGLADLISVSNYLKNRDFTNVSNGNEAYRVILEDLKPFTLPKMTGLSKKSHSSFSAFQSGALNFFNYSSFINTKDRDKALKRLEDLRKDLQQLEFDTEQLGHYQTIEDMLDELQDYIENRTEESRQNLYSVDFVFLYEKVLNYKPKIDKKKPVASKIRRLKGVAPEVFLHALWLALGDLRKDTKKQSIYMLESIKKVTIQSVLFKHDFDSGEEGNEAQIAERFLVKVLGGLDGYLTDSIRIPRQESGNMEEPLINFEWKLSPVSNNSMEYMSLSTGDPYLKFEIRINYADSETLKKEFLWMLPGVNQTRLMVDLFDLAKKHFAAGGNMLPAFAIPYISEVFEARDEIECTRLIQSSFQKECKIIDLIKAEGLDNTELLKPHLERISFAYQNFLMEIDNHGFFAALNNNFLPLEQSVYDAYETFVNTSSVSTAGPLLWKAFIVVDEGHSSSGLWPWDDHVEAAIITPLHPVLLEMMKHQYSFLCDSFCYYAEEALRASNDKLFAPKIWYRVTDLSAMQWPVLGTLAGVSRILDTSVRSFDYIHLIGAADKATSFLNSRILLEDIDEEEDIADEDLFRETQASSLIKQIISDYQSLYPYALDGITIGAYCSLEVQPIIAGIDSHLASFLKEREEPFSLRINIFSDSRDDTTVMRWLNAWKGRWQQAELSTSMKHYSNCRISIAYRVVSRENNAEQFKRLLNQTEMDIMFLADFVDLEGSNFEPVQDEMCADDYRRFPILEKMSCKKIGGGQDYKRERILSNNRFRLGTAYTGVMAHLQNQHLAPKKRNIVISSSNFNSWVEIINMAHAHNNWVVCIDPSVDEQLLLNTKDEREIKREIVGFGSGVGAHGENNFTISTEQFLMRDIRKKVSAYIGALFAPLEQNIADAIADSLLKEALHIAGLSIIKATGPERFVREFIANSLVRKMLPRETDVFCDEIFSLDAFVHWFNDPFNSRRPDLLRIKATIVKGYFDIDAQLIECKLAHQSEGYLQEAREQIENGLRQLVWKFAPQQGEGTIGIFDPPDQRYWWMQLHRLIASKGEVSLARFKDVLLALERLSDGCFNITWNAAVVAIWTNQDDDQCESNAEWNFTVGEKLLDINVAQLGRGFLQKACLENRPCRIFVGNNEVSFGFMPQDMQDEGEETEGEKDIGTGSEIDTNGEQVDEIRTPVKSSSKMKNEKANIPSRVLLGRGVNTVREVFWEFGHQDLPNRHLLIFGASGMGKTYAIQAIMYELAKYKQNSLIVDYTNGFMTSQLENIIKEVLNPKQHIVRREPLPINPFRQQCDIIEEFEIPENSVVTAQRVSGVFSEIYQLGDQQKSALYTAIRNGVDELGDSFSLKALMQRLEIISHEGGPTASPAASVITKIQPFVDTTPFGVEDPESWERLFRDNDSQCHVIQLAGFSKDFAQLITEFSLIDLYRYYRAKGSKDNPKVVVLDEIQNLDHRLESPLGQFLTEGRKFGIALILATQTLSNLSKDERDRLFQASHKLFFKPADTEIRTYANILADATGEKSETWIERLTTLKRGECYSLGFAFNEAKGKLEPNKYTKIQISDIESRVEN